MTFQSENPASVSHHIAILTRLLQFIPAEDWSLSFSIICWRT